jgi:hypothetical protein
MRRFLVACAATVIASHGALAEDHTASWYAAHPSDMDAQIAACLDDPGHARHVANCANASQGQILRDGARESARYAAMNAQGDRQQEQQWRANPQQLLVRLKMCNAQPSAAIRAAWDCNMAFATAQSMTGHR